MIDPSPFRNEIHAVTAAPWSHAHPRSDHQLVFPLSGDRLLFVWCAYYVRRPSAIALTPFAEGASLQDDAPCQISARVSSDRGRTWSDVMTLQENHGASNVKHPNLLRLPSGRILFSYTERDAAAQRLRVRLRMSDDDVRDLRPVARHHAGPGLVFHQRRPHPPAQLGADHPAVPRGADLREGGPLAGVLPVLRRRGRDVAGEPGQDGSSEAGRRGAGGGRAARRLAAGAAADLARQAVPRLVDRCGRDLERARWRPSSTRRPWRPA